jgi:hypothetical protein
MENLNIANIAGGALVEQVDAEINKVLNNILDPNTNPIKKRKITVTLTFLPSEDRTADVVFETKSTIVPIKPGLTRIAYDKDSNGSILAEELRRGAMTGQATIDLETGEVLEAKVPSKVINIK